MRALLISLAVFFATIAQGQVTGGGGVIYVAGDPNTEKPTIRYGEEAVIAFSTGLRKLYVYDNSQASGSKWKEVAIGSTTDTDTYLDQPYTTSDSLIFLKKDKTGTVIGSTAILLSAFHKISEVNGMTGSVVIDLQKSGNTLSITGDPTSVDLSAYVNTDAQTLSYTNATGQVSISGGNTIQIPVMTGATVSAQGQRGLVPMPDANTQNKFLRGDGTWADATTTSTDDQTAVEVPATATAPLTGANVQAQLDEIAAILDALGTQEQWENIATTTTVGQATFTAAISPPADLRKVKVYRNGQHLRVGAAGDGQAHVIITSGTFQMMRAISSGESIQVQYKQ